MVEMVDGVRLLLGGRALLTAPSAARTQFGRAGTPGELALLRVLGVRHIVQTVISVSTGWRALSAGVDVLHATSMLITLAIAPRRSGRFAALQVAASILLVVLELVGDRRG